MSWHRVFYLSFLFLAVSRGLPTEECPILGPTFPSNFDVSDTSAFRDAASAFPGIVESLFSSGAVNRTHSSFTIDVFSASTNRSIYRYQHAAPALNGTLNAGVLDDGTIFRIGSVAKLYTAYAILAHAGMDVLDQPVTKYLPSLAGNSQSKPLEGIIWEDVTIRALASYQGGTGGYPLETAGCFASSPSECTPEAFLALMRSKRPIFPAFETTLYSDAAYGILGLVLAHMTGLPYADAMQRTLFEPLGLNGTSAVKPSNEGFNGLVIPGTLLETSWGYDDPILAPSGGLYSNNADLRKAGLSILHSQLLSPASTRSWMKPTGHTASLTKSVGVLWEIERLPLNVSASSSLTRICDLYTKLGGNHQYSGVFALSPDHGIGYSVLTAGPQARSDRYPLRDAVGTAFVTAAEHGAAENAASNLVGTFADRSAEGTNLTLTVEEDRPGLGLESMFVDGVEWRAKLWGLGEKEEAAVRAANITVRLYPTNPASLSSWSSSGDGTAASKQISMRAVPQTLPPGPRSAAEGGQGLFDNGCGIWQTTGFFPIDEFVFDIVDGRLESVTSIGAERQMRRVD